jgi:hypothetical protein
MDAPDVKVDVAAFKKELIRALWNRLEEADERAAQRFEQSVRIADALSHLWARRGYCVLCERTVDFAGRHEKWCPLRGYNPTTPDPLWAWIEEGASNV